MRNSSCDIGELRIKEWAEGGLHHTAPTSSTRPPWSSALRKTQKIVVLVLSMLLLWQQLAESLFLGALVLGFQVLICRSVKCSYGFEISILGDTPDLTRYDPERPDLIWELGITSKLALLWAGGRIRWCILTRIILRLQLPLQSLGALPWTAMCSRKIWDSLLSAQNCLELLKIFHLNTASIKWSK